MRRHAWTNDRHCLFSDNARLYLQLYCCNMRSGFDGDGAATVGRWWWRNGVRCVYFARGFRKQCTMNGWNFIVRLLTNANAFRVVCSDDGDASKLVAESVQHNSYKTSPLCVQLNILQYQFSSFHRSANCTFRAQLYSPINTSPPSCVSSISQPALSGGREPDSV